MNPMHPVSIASVDVFPIRAVGGVSPSMALGLMPTRPALLIRLTDDDGCSGWGEIWANFPPRANIHKAHIVEDIIAPCLRGSPGGTPEEANAYLRQKLSTYFLHVGQKQVFEHILAGVDIAHWDLCLRSAGKSFATHMNLLNCNAPTYASSINQADLEPMMQHHAALGQSQFKLKLGFDDSIDKTFVQQAADLLPAGAQIMIDNNQTWEKHRAQHMLEALKPFDLLFAEEPIPADASAEDWRALADESTIPLAGGENLYGIKEFLKMTDAGIRFVQPDVAKWGGVSGALELAKALPSGVRLWPHFMGTAVGQMAALSVTAAVGKTSTCEMDVNLNPLRTELCGDTMNISDGCVTLPDSPGLVVPPLPEMLEQFREGRATHAN